MTVGQSKARVEKFLSRLNGETPRSRILLASGLLEELLRAAILQRLAKNKSSDKLFGKGCSLGLSTLATYAHALGLIGDKEHDAIKKYADARNLIAHDWEADFSGAQLQEIASKIQLIGVKGESRMEPHQRCFARLDYLGLFLTEELINRFASIPASDFRGGVFLKSMLVDPVTGERVKKVEYS